MVTILSRIGLGLILGYCFLASVLFSFFAQMHVTFAFLPFPIFVGEIVLIICLGLFAVICGKAAPFDKRTAVLLGLYFGWVLIKALINYVHDGPLTCRNAALFYYPVFAVFSYCFYRRAAISRQAWQVLGLFAAGVLLFKLVFAWYWWTYVVLFVVLVLNTKASRWRRIGWIFLLVIVCLGKGYLYKESRAHFISVLCAVVFLIFYFACLLARRGAFKQLIILLVPLGIFILGFFMFSNKNDIHSMTSVSGLIKNYQEYEVYYQQRQASFVSPKLEVHLYNPKNFETVFSSTQPPVFGNHMSAAETNKKNILNGMVHGRSLRDRNLEMDENDILFRLFIWHDMIREFLTTPKAWLMGFSFGHPQRSRTLEILTWADTEWRRDGWITPHNSYLHIIYRAGLLGVAFIIVLLSMFVRLIKDFYRKESAIGSFLVAGLVYWFVLSNFFVILEFPYNAILIWTFFGITLAYRDQLKKNNEEPSQNKN